MADRKKVIKGLESLRNICNAKSDMAIGKGKVAWAGYANTAGDALALLKAQEPIEPRVVYDSDKTPIGLACGYCGCMVDALDFYCAHCGRKVKL